MSATGIDVIEWGLERVRAGPWRGDPTVAYLNPAPGAMPPSVDFVLRCLDSLAGDGFTRVVTGALSAPEQASFAAAGFRVSEDLHLLAHDLRRLPPPSTAPGSLRRAARSDHALVLGIDDVAFDWFWRLGDAGLGEALAATPHCRFSVATVSPDHPEAPAVAGYAVTGRAGRRGYLQRVAVHPDYQGRGLGRALVGDGLRWLRRWRVDQALVNTQLGNLRALTLYESLGFRREPSRLSVLGIDLPT